MKSTTLLSQAIFTTATVSAFTQPSARSCSRSMPLHATLTADVLSTMSKESQLEALGVEEEKLALGIDPDEVLEHIGTRDDLIAKFTNDISSFSPTEVQAEVDKFLMDGEMLDMYIKYSQRKAEDPDWSPIYAQEDNSIIAKVSAFVGQYGVYVIGGIVVKDIAAEYLEKHPEVAEGLNLPSLPSFGGIGAGAGSVAEGGEVLVSSALDSIHHLTNMMV